MQEEEGIENGWMYGLFPSHPERSLAIARFAVDWFILPSLTISTPQRLEKSFEGQILNPSMDKNQFIHPHKTTKSSKVSHPLHSPSHKYLILAVC